MTNNIRIAIDAMSGDFGPRSAMLAVQKTLTLQKNLHITVVGDISVLSTFPSDPRVELIASDDVVLMSDKPAFALRHRRQSSMAQTVQLVADDRADACISSGNTGALMALSSHILKRLPGVSRPAICKLLPSLAKPSLMLDLGANTYADAGQLLQFALMGAALRRADVVKSRPVTVALLNIGVERGKGLAHIGEAAELFEASTAFEYAGFIEPDHLFDGVVDVVVCDGFTGNIALKSCEGTARYIRAVAERSMTSSLLSRLQALLAFPLLSRWNHRFSPDTYNGASLLGLNGVVVKSHGDAGVDAICGAIDVACEQVESRALERIQNSF